MTAILTSRNELDVLLTDLECARYLLLLAPETSPGQVSKSQMSTKIVKWTTSAETAKFRYKSSPTKAFFRRVTTTFRLGRSRSHKRYDQLEETESLICDRRGSGDSDATLVATAQVDHSAHLLEVLAPLVSALQRITPRISIGMGDFQSIKEAHHDTCEKLSGLVEEVKETVLGEEGVRDEHDFDMACLMLDALTKKILMEQFKVTKLLAREEDAETLVNGFNGPKGAAAHVSQLLPAGRNPFILHSTSIALAPRRASETQSQPIAGQHGPAAGTYSAFASGAQQLWARNVIRLGSYQNSLLFSPSPVAVRPLVAISQVK